MQHRLSYSQFGEDITASNALRSVSPGFYVDVGAHHPLNLSNTALMHLSGWDGINVEPRLDSIRAFDKHRPRALNLRAAIHNEHSEVTLHKFDGGRIDTVLGGRAERLSTTKRAIGTEVVPAMSLNQLFEDFVPSDIRVNYLSIDIEGYDQEAILAFDLNKHRPDLICAELHRFEVHTLADNRMVRHLTSHGYMLYAVNIMSFTFVHSDAAERLGIWQLLPQPSQSKG